MSLLKRTTHQSMGFTSEQMEGFSLLSHQASAIAITNRLTGSQFRLWHYLMMVDPFADQTQNGERIYHKIPSPTEIGIAIGSSSRTVEKDMQRLEKLGLYAKRVTSWQGYNLSAESARAASDAIRKAKVEGKSKNAYSAYQKTPEPLSDKGGYLAANPVISPESRLNSRESGYLAGVENAETQSEQDVQGSKEASQTIQINLDQQDNCVVVGQKEVEEVMPTPLSSDQPLEEGQPREDTPVNYSPSLPIPPSLCDKAKEPSEDKSSVAGGCIDKQPTSDEVKEALRQLREMRIATNGTIEATIRKYYSRVGDAIAHIKERIAGGEHFVNLGGAFVQACKDGAKPTNTGKSSWGYHLEVNPPSEEEEKQLELALAKSLIQARSFSTDNIRKVLLPGDFMPIPWWEFLKTQTSTENIE